MDWVHCNQCFYRLGWQPKKELILTSCGHILCKTCERSERVERCKVCNASCSTVPLTSQMPDDVRTYFEDLETTIEKTLKVMEFQKSHRLRLADHEKTQWEKYQKIKFAYQRLEEEYKKIKTEFAMLRRNMMTPPPPPNNPLFRHYSQQSPVPFMNMNSQEDRRSSTPLFATPARSVSSMQNYRRLNTPPTPKSDSSTSPGSEASQQSFRSRSSSQRMYRPGLTPPVDHLSLLSVSRENPRDSNSRF